MSPRDRESEAALWRERIAEKAPRSRQRPKNKKRGANRQHGGIISKLISLISFLLLLLLLYVLRHPILRTMGDFWVVSDPASQADAIIVLADDNYTGDRAAKAAEVYRAHEAPLIVVSGHMLRPYFGVGELMRKDLTDRGVPAGSVLIYPHNGGNTREEALALRSLVVQRGWSRLIIVTSNYHTRRARYIWRRVLPSGVNFWMASAPDHEYDPDHWWESRIGIKTFAYEMVGMCVAIWELRHATANDSGAFIGLAKQLGALVAR